MVHKIYPSECGEVSFAAYSEEPSKDPNQEHLFWDTEAKQMAGSFWTIPTNYECCKVDMSVDMFKARNIPDLFTMNYGKFTEDEDQREKPEFFVNNQVDWIRARIPKYTVMPTDADH